MARPIVTGVPGDRSAQVAITDPSGALSNRMPFTISPFTIGSVNNSVSAAGDTTPSVFDAKQECARLGGYNLYNFGAYQVCEDFANSKPLFRWPPRSFNCPGAGCLGLP